MSKWTSFRDKVTKPVKRVGDIATDIYHGDLDEAFKDFVKLGGDITVAQFELTGLPAAGRAALDYITPSVPPVEYEDRERMTNGAANARRIVYGQAKVGGQVAYWESSGDDDVYFHVISVFAAHSCAELGDIYFGDKLAFQWNGSSHVAQGDFVGKAIMYFETGKQSVANASVVSDTPANWSTSHKLLGQTYAYFKLTYDTTVYSGGVPNVSAVIKGKDTIWDPRTNTYGYSSNHALCCLDYLIWEDGLRANVAELNIDSFRYSADISDQLVSSGAGKIEKRYTVNGSLSYQAAALDNFQELLKAGAASCPAPNGVFTFVPGVYDAPSIPLIEYNNLAFDLAANLTGTNNSSEVLSFNESDLISGLQFSPGAGKNGRYNYAKGTFVDPANNYSLVEFVQLPVDGYIARDQEELVYDQKWPLTNSGTAARRLSKIAIENSRFGLTVSATFKYKMLNAIVGDRITLSISDLGWDYKVFRVIDLSFGLMTGVKVVLREDSADVWDWQEGDALEVPVPPALNIPSGLVVTTPTNLLFSEELYSTNAKTQIKTRVFMSWTGGASDIAYDIQYRIPGGAWITGGTYWQANDIALNDFELGLYQFRVRSINGLGKKSDWASSSYTVLGKLAPPPDVPGMVITDGLLSWSYPDKPDDFLGFKVRAVESDQPIWTIATDAHKGYISHTSFDVSNQLGGTKTFLVKAIDTSLIESENAAYVISGLGDPDVGNIILSQEYKGLGWPGDISYNGLYIHDYFYPSDNTNFYPTENTGIYQNESGLIDGDGNITAIDQNLFYGSPDALYYSGAAELYYNTSFLDLIYDFSYTVDPLDKGSQLVVSYVTTSSEAYLQRFALDSRDVSTLSPFGGVIKRAEEGEYRFRLVVPGGQNIGIPKITSVVVSLDVPDIIESLNDAAISSAGTRLTLTKSYRAIKHVSLTIQDDASGAVTAKIFDRDATLGPLIKVFNDLGNPVNTTIDADIRGY